MRWALTIGAGFLVVLTGCSAGSGTSATSNPAKPLQAPIANAGGPYSGSTGTAVSFSAARSSDPNGQTLTYTWNFGDGGTGTGVAPTHTYTTAGAYSVSLGVTDTSGLANSASSQAVIAAAIAGSVNGVVYDGSKPIAGAHVYLFAAGTTGYGLPSVSLLNAAMTGHSDSVGGYVLTASDGSFLWNGYYSCTPGTQVYAYALGGTPTGLTANAAIGLLAALGNCPASGNFSSVPTVWINEVSTTAAAHAFAGFATDATHVSSSGTALAQVGIANAFANAANLSALQAGIALAVTPGQSGAAPQSEINTMANILAACIASGSSSSATCSKLFSNARSIGAGATPAETATAAINIAQNPGANVAALYALAASASPFAPALSAPPNDFTVSISFTGGGLSSPAEVAVDGAGDVWASNILVSTISELNSTGVALSSVSGYTGGGLGEPNGIAIDASGNAWIANIGSGGETEISSSGATLTGINGFASCGTAYTHSVAIDPSGNVWFTTSFGGGGLLDAQGLINAGCLAEVSGAGAPISPVVGYGDGYFDQPYGIAMDTTGGAWVANQGANTLTHISSSGSPLTPFAGLTGGGLNGPVYVAIDNAGNVWAGNTGSALSSTLSEFSSAGVPLSPTQGYTGGGLSYPQGLAIDGSGNVWVANFHGSSVSEFSNEGTPITPSTGFTGAGLAGPDGLAVDGSGDVWVAPSNGNNLVEFIGVATPVVTPLAVGVKTNKLGARP